MTTNQQDQGLGASANADRGSREPSPKGLGPDGLRSTSGARFYIDCEFDGHNGPLLSIALVREDGRSIHIRTTVEARDPWVVANVVPLMGSHQATVNWHVALTDEVGVIVTKFIGDCDPIIIADSPQDARYFSQALTTSPDGGYAPFPFNGMTIEIHGVDCYPTDLPGAVQHNAWWDAMALRYKLTGEAE